jgi:hypothetical protein
MIGMSLARDLLGARQFPHFWHFRTLVRGSMIIYLCMYMYRFVPSLQTSFPSSVLSALSTLPQLNNNITIIGTCQCWLSVSCLCICIHRPNAKMLMGSQTSLLSRRHPEWSQLCGVCKQLRSWEGPQRAQTQIPTEKSPGVSDPSVVKPQTQNLINSTKFRTIQNYCIKSNYQIRKVLLQTQEGCKGAFLLPKNLNTRTDPTPLSQAGASCRDGKYLTLQNI